jgi:hypothetical protein
MSDHTNPLPEPAERTIVLSIDGNQWSALEGSNLQEGNAAFADTAGAALRKLDPSLDPSEPGLCPHGYLHWCSQCEYNLREYALRSVGYGT